MVILIGVLILLTQLILLGSLIWTQVKWIWELTPEQLEQEIRRRGYEQDN